MILLCVAVPTDLFNCVASHLTLMSLCLLYFCYPLRPFPQITMSATDKTHVTTPEYLLRTTVRCIISSNDRSSFKMQNISLTTTDIRENVKGPSMVPHATAGYTASICILLSTLTQL